MSHGDRVSSLPEGFEIIGISPNAPFAAIADETRKYYGVQFHPEVVHTPNGAKMLRNFTHEIAGFKGDWSMASFKDEMIKAIQGQVGDGKVICGLSGGVDSSVAAVLIHEAIGDQLTCVYVDTGMMRKGESDQVTALFRDHYDIDLIHVDAGEEFLTLLSGVKDPEKKRKIIGGTFIDIFEREAKKVGGAKFLAQGTLYPDVIESVSFDGGPSVTINKKHGLYNEIWQAFAVLLPVQTVGVMGDSRTYDFVLALRAVTSTDGMTADYYPYSHEFLGETATRIINEVRGVNRVVYDVTSKPPGTIEWE